MLLIETLQTALTGADIYYWFVIGFGDINHLATPYASAFDVPIIGAIISLTVQFFFAYRVWVLGNRKLWWLVGIICLVRPLSQFAIRRPYYPFPDFYRRLNGCRGRRDPCEPFFVSCIVERGSEVSRYTYKDALLAAGGSRSWQW